MEKRILWLAVLFLWLGPGCSPNMIEGRKIDSEKIKQLTLSQTTSNKMEELFGKPPWVEKAGQAMEIYIYQYAATEPNWWTIPRVERQKFEAVMQNGLLEHYRLVWEDEEAILRP